MGKNREPQIPKKESAPEINDEKTPEISAQVLLNQFLQKNNIVLEIPQSQIRNIEGGGLVISPPNQVFARFKTEFKKLKKQNLK